MSSTASYQIPNILLPSVQLSRMLRFSWRSYFIYIFFGFFKQFRANAFSRV